MTENEAIEKLKTDNCVECGYSDNATTCDYGACGVTIATRIAIKALEEIQQYRAIGTVDECRAAVEKQKGMIVYCDENDCSDCPYHNGHWKENKCMNDFIADEISKGCGVNE